MSNSAYEQILENLQFLKSKESLDVLDKTFDHVNKNNLSFIEGFLYFTQAQVEKKKANLISHSVHMAGFPKLKSLTDFDFSFQPSINQQQIYDLNSLRFIEKQENVVFYGNSGVGKTHLATAIGMTAAQNRKSTYFVKCADLMESLRKAYYEGRLAERLKKFSGYRLLIIDELGYLPISKEDSKLFFQLIDKRYERNSTIITTNINFAQWDEIFGDPMIAGAIVDRLLHHAIVITIKGKSYRLQNLYVAAEDEAQTS